MDGEDRFMQDSIDIDRLNMFNTDTMINRKTRALHDYWEGLRAGRLAPMRSDVDPRDMPCDVRNVFILEMLAANNFRFRVAGSALAKAFGIELRGMNACAIMARDSRESFNALMNEALEDPGVGYARLVPSREPNILWEISLLPLRSDFGPIDRLIGILNPVKGPPGHDGGPLQFRIERMQINTIVPTVLEAGALDHVTGFAETQARFRARDEELHPGGKPAPSLQAIEGGLDENDAPEPRRTGHLRLIED